MSIKPGLSVLLLLFGPLFGTPSLATSLDRLPGNRYFLIQENTQNPGFQAPQELLKEGSQKTLVNIMQLVDVRRVPPTPPEPYSRKAQFGAWIKPQLPQNCHSTRALVLMRDSRGPVSFSKQNPCLVEKGLWEDLYSGQRLTHAAQIQVDHLVPLKHAYISGGFQWVPALKCAYSNFMGNEFHLLPVFGEENNRKGDKSPDQYIPANPKVTCLYLEYWMKTKAIWRLALSEPEALAINQMIAQLRCDRSRFQMKMQDLKTQRDAIRSLGELCVRLGRSMSDE